MISIIIDDCSFDIIPIVRGLVSETDKVKEALSKKDYDCAAVAWGIEDIEAVTRRDEIKGDNETNDLDIVYSYKLTKIGNIDMPDPAFTYLVDEYNRKGQKVIPLDMDDTEYSSVYCATVSTFDFLKEKKIVKKAFKTEFDMSSPETFVMQWDALMNKIKGYKEMSQKREKFIAEQLVDLAKYKKNVLALVDYERLDGIMARIEELTDDVQ